MRRFRVDQFGRPVLLPQKGHRGGMHGFGDAEHLAVPMGTGAPGNPMYPYDESNPVWNPGGLNTTGMTPGSMPSMPMPGGITLPSDPNNGNRTSQSAMATIPLSGQFVTTVPIVNSNPNRNFLLVQNNSSATTPDTAATLYMTFDAPLQGAFGLQLAIPPLTGVFFDSVVPINAIFMAIGPFLNGGATSVIAGCLIQGIAIPQGS